jgi:hypothetical protein
MGGLILLLAASTSAGDFGWQKRDEGGMEYLIQIPPDAVDVLRSGDPLIRDVPSDLREHLRGFRVTIGTAVLPRDEIPAPAEPAPESAAASAPPDEESSRAAPFPAVPPSFPAQDPLTAKAAVVPDTLPSDTGGKPIGEQPASYEQTTKQPPEPESEISPSDGRPPSDEPPPSEDSPPWKLWTWASLLALSLGVNLYQGWIFGDLRRRHRRLLTQTSSDVVLPQ